MLIIAGIAFSYFTIIRPLYKKYDLLKKIKIKSLIG